MDSDDEPLDTTLLSRSRTTLGWPVKSILRRHQFVDTTADVIDRNPLDRLCPKIAKQRKLDSSSRGCVGGDLPKVPSWSACRRPSRSPSSCRRLLEYTPREMHLWCNWWEDKFYLRLCEGRQRKESSSSECNWTLIDHSQYIRSLRANMIHL